MNIKKKLKELLHTNPYFFTHEVSLRNGEVTEDVYSLRKYYKGGGLSTWLYSFTAEELEQLKESIDKILDSRF